MIGNNEILKELKHKESRLISELTKVQLAIKAFGGEEALNDLVSVGNLFEYGGSSIPQPEFDINATYDEKILWALRKLGRPSNVKEIVEILLQSGEVKGKVALIGRVTHNASKMYRAKKIDADATRRQYRYFIGKQKSF